MIRYHLPDVGIILIDWFMTESLEVILDNSADALFESDFVFTQSDLEKAVYDELWFQVSRHEAPHFSNSIKEWLKAQGVPVTVEAVLDAAFAGSEDAIKGYIQEYGVEALASGKLESLWGPDEGCFYFSPEELKASWKRLGII